MRLKPHRGRSKRPHHLDDEIAKMELELYRLRGIRRAELSAEARRDPIGRAKAAAGSKAAWKNKAIRAARCEALSAAWTPERRKAQAERMRAMRADPQKFADMYSAQIRTQRSTEYRKKAAAKSREVWKRTQAPKPEPGRDAVERVIFGGGE